jgi:hypothetical protein
MSTAKESHMNALKLLPFAALLLATSVQAGGVICPSPEPLMLPLCNSAEHSSKMFAALRRGDVETTSSEAGLATSEINVFAYEINVIVQKLSEYASESMLKSLPPTVD